MSRYASIDCPICNRPLDNGEEVVVCPDCGAPYHRSCIAETGGCIFPKLHEEGKSWESPKPVFDEKKLDKDVELRCPRCGTVNPPHGIFCQVCGHQLSDAAAGAEEGQDNPMGQGMPFHGIPLNPYTTPFGGVAPDEEIDGVPAKDMAAFVGKNSHYFLPVFKQLSQSGRKLLNWGAFFFQGGYFLYRKMYVLGIVLLLVNLLLGAPNTMLMIKTLEAGTAVLTAAESAVLDNLAALSTVCSFVTLGVRFFCGLMANSFYKKHCIRMIAKEKTVERPNEEYYAALSKKGSVATKLIAGLLTGYVALYMISAYVLILFGGV